MRTLRDLGDLQGKRVLLRVDFNVPLDERGQVADDSRIRAALPTIAELRNRGAALVLVSHLGRPKDREPELSMRAAANRLAELTGADVTLAPGVIGGEVEAFAANLSAGDVLVLENVRYEPGETRNDPELAAGLARLADVYVDDAFGVAHRAHASTEGVARLLDERAAGLLLEREMTVLTELLEDPARPLVAVLGGAKVSDKIAVIERFLHIADTILIGGAMCFPFLAARVTRSATRCATPRTSSSPGTRSPPPTRAPRSSCPSTWCRRPLRRGSAAADDRRSRRARGVDGPRHRSADGGRVPEVIEAAGTVFWNGPMGAFELAPFAAGTRAVAEAVAQAPGTTVVGGGDSAAALAQFGLGERGNPPVDRRRRGARADRGQQLPGVEALNERLGTGRIPLIAGNWKMNKTVCEAEGSSQALLPRMSAVQGWTWRSARRTPRSEPMVDSARGSRVQVYAQNMHQRRQGAFTGEVSAPMLLEVGVQGVILGHSERRELFGETDRALQLKVPAALAAGLVPILCVGETEEEREAGDTERKLRHQVQEDLARVDTERLGDVVIAYEPIWAIGTGQVATPEQAQDAIAFIRALVGDRDREQSERVRVLYGGSVKPASCPVLLALPDVDGALVGGASLDPDSFAAIVDAAAA